MRVFFEPLPLCRSVAAICLSLGAAAVHAQVLDRIDVVPREVDAEIVIRFSGKVLYQRHVSQQGGDELRVFLQLIDFRQGEGELVQETARSARTERVPDVVARYPEIANGMLVKFSRPIEHAVRPGEDGRSIIITVPLLPAPRPGEAAAGGATQGAASAEGAAVPADVEARAAGFIQEARDAIAANAPVLAINRLNRVLGLPTNAQTEAAQALIGQARALNGEFAKARAEYELYLKLFPNGHQAAFVSEQLGKLPKGDQAARGKRPLPKEAGPSEWTYFGSISSYYYTGKSQVETLVAPPPGQLTYNRDTLSAIDQRSLITSLNLNARRRDAFSDTRVVFRNTDNHNYLRPDRSYSRVYSAYVDHVDRNAGYYLRAGRQNPSGIGVLERFDGVQGGYDFAGDWRVNAVQGKAVEFLSPFDKSFFGASVERVAQVGQPGASLYAVQQTLDGNLNRRAFGSEMRYFDGRTTTFGQLDYDVLYKGVNIAMLQGNYLSEGGSNYFFAIDHRRAPSYALTNALPGAPGLSLSDLIAAEGLDAVRRHASNLTAISNMFSIGMTRQLSETWQVGTDYRMSEISSTAAVDVAIPLGVIGTCLGLIDTVNNNCILNTASQQGSGRNHAVSFQAIGSNLGAPGAVGVSNLSLILAPTFTGQALSLSYVRPVGTQWRFDTNLRYYTQRDDAGGTQSRLTPSVKAAWQWQTRLFIEGEVGRERARTNSTDRQDTIDRGYLYMGLRWDVR